MSTCRSCGAIIDWVELKSGKKMPVDPEYCDYAEAEPGDKLITDEGEVIGISAENIKSNLNFRGRISHFSTCPQANEWRKK